MARTAPIEFLPRTRAGLLGLALSALTIAGFIAIVATDSPDRGRNPWAYLWLLVVVAGAVEIFAIWRRGERSLLAILALAPFALLVVLLAMEATGLME